MPIIYVKDMKNVAVCRALFEAAAKTQKGITEKILAKQSLTSLPGVYSPLLDEEIEECLWSSRHGESLREIGYLRVNLKLKIDSVDATDYEKIYGISAISVLKEAGFTCGNEPLKYYSYKSSSSIAPIVSFYTPSNKTEKKSQAETDKRFQKSTQDGVIFEAITYGLIPDEDIIEFGAKRWERRKYGVDHIVLVYEMENTPKNLSSLKIK